MAQKSDTASLGLHWRRWARPMPGRCGSFAAGRRTMEHIFLNRLIKHIKHIQSIFICLTFFKICSFKDIKHMFKATFSCFVSQDALLRFVFVKVSDVFFSFFFCQAARGARSFGEGPSGVSVGDFDNKPGIFQNIRIFWSSLVILSQTILGSHQWKWIVG